MASQEQTPEDPKKDHAPLQGHLTWWQVMPQEFPGLLSAQLVCERKPEHLEPWLARAAESPLVPLQRFASGLGPGGAVPAEREVSGSLPGPGAAGPCGGTGLPGKFMTVMDGL